MDSKISENRQKNIYHHTPFYEKQLMQIIRSGNIEELKVFLDRSHLDGEMGILSKKDPLRNSKNMAVCCITLATRAAMDGGVPSETAYTTSDIFIQKIEELTDRISVPGAGRSGIPLLYGKGERGKDCPLYQFNIPVHQLY